MLHIISNPLLKSNSTTLLRGYGKVLLMGEKRPTAQQVLKEKVQALLDEGMSEFQLGVSQRTANNMKNAKGSTTLRSLQKLADKLNLEPWQLLRPASRPVGVSEVALDSSKADVRFGSTRLEKQLLAYLSDPGIAESILGLLTAVSGRKTPRGKVRLSAYGGARSVHRPRQGSVRRKGPTSPDS